MTMDKSLRTSLGLVRARGVLTRGERIAKLQEMDRFRRGPQPAGLAKGPGDEALDEEEKEGQGRRVPKAKPPLLPAAAAGAKAAAPARQSRCSAAKAAAPAKSAGGKK